MTALASMDRRNERKRFPPARIGLHAGVAVAFTAAIVALATRSGATTRIFATGVTTATTSTSTVTTITEGGGTSLQRAGTPGSARC